MCTAIVGYWDSPSHRHGTSIPDTIRVPFIYSASTPDKHVPTSRVQNIWIRPLRSRPTLKTKLLVYISKCPAEFQMERRIFSYIYIHVSVTVKRAISSKRLHVLIVIVFLGLYRRSFFFTSLNFSLKCMDNFAGSWLPSKRQLIVFEKTTALFPVRFQCTPWLHYAPKTCVS